MLMLLSLAGIPVTAGFIGKFYAIAAGVSAQLWILVVLLALNSAVGVYYYLRVIVTMFDSSGPSKREFRPSAQMAGDMPWVIRAPLGVVLLLLLFLGLYPQPVIELIGFMFSAPTGGHTAHVSF